MEWDLSALALAGSVIGALASFAATWVTQHFRDQREMLNQEAARRERLFGDFVDQASRAYADGLVHESLDDPASLVPLYATINKLRLFATQDTVHSAEGVMDSIVMTFETPGSTLHSGKQNIAAHDILRVFAESCRTELKGLR